MQAGSALSASFERMLTASRSRRSPELSRTSTVSASRAGVHGPLRMTVPSFMIFCRAVGRYSGGNTPNSIDTLGVG